METSNCRAAATAPATHTAPRMDPAAGRLIVTDDILYSVRVPPAPMMVDCPVCCGRFLAAGPTGFADSEPICDHCLLEQEQQLGMVLALASVTRSFAILPAENPLEHFEALAELGAFARIYEKVASQHAPPRPFRPSGLT